ncbi:MAG: hypothetical protein ACI87E_000190 [Mariniblastus sp.]|jgi:hypothetical protein
MIRVCLFVTCLAISLMSVGCCGPMGPGCGIPMGCSDCDGVGQGRVGGPLSGLRQMKRSLVCGSGCGEVYVGEWMSTPPDSQDPCCGDQWVGGASKCRPFCWQPGAFLSGLYGVRNCSGTESSTPCGCGESMCDGGCGIETGYVQQQVAGGCSTGNCGGGGGCATCNARGSGPANTQMVQQIPASDRMTRSASASNMSGSGSYPRR